MALLWDDLIDRWDANLRRAFLESIYNIRNQAQIELIARLLEQGDVNGALRAVGIDPVKFRPLDSMFSQAFEAGGKATAATVPVTRAADGFRTLFQFDVRNVAAEAWLKNHSSTLIREIVDDQRDMVREHLRAGMEKGQNPRAVALDLVGRVSSGRREGGVIGLTNSQAEWVRNYADELENDPAASLERKLRDKRFDPAVKRAVESGEPIPADLREKMEQAYKNRALRMRAEAIARTEAMRALHQAQEEAMQQAVASGAVSQAAVQFVWRTARDRRVRDSHRSMNGQVRPAGRPFVSGSGNNLLYPGDPKAPIAETANCRCFREPTISHLRGIR